MKKAHTRLFLAGLTISLFFTTSVRATLGGTMTLTANGNSMFPTILDGDTIIVELSNEGERIKAGPKNSSTPGDIIVYCTIAATACMPEPKAMWIGHRAILKYVKDGVWYFKTQGDGNSKPDEWEVPEYYLLGVVVQITHSMHTQVDRVGTSNDNPLTPFDSLILPAEFLGGIGLGVLISMFRRVRAKKESCV